MSTELDAAKFLALLADERSQAKLADITADVVHRKLLGRQLDSYNVDNLAFLAAGISSSEYAIRRMAKAARLLYALDLLEFALKKVTSDGLVVEFGVFTGRTTNHIAAMLPDQKVYGFDSFEGLPETWRPGFQKGAFATKQLPPVRSNVELIVGYFDRTLPDFLDNHAGQPVSFMHVDCDLYSSTQTVLHCLKDRIGPGAIIVFDEYYNYPGWQLHEFRAFQEFITTTDLHYEYVGIVPGHQQVAVRIAG
jgi:predicted O-methyltransferase YrrM